VVCNVTQSTVRSQGSALRDLETKLQESELRYLAAVEHKQKLEDQEADWDRERRQ
jgi:hypothetical protein